MNTLSRFWTAIHTPPPAHAAVELRFADGSSSLVMWGGAPTFAGQAILRLRQKDHEVVQPISSAIAKTSDLLDSDRRQTAVDQVAASGSS